MEYKQLGKSELIASRIGFGCWAIGGHGYGNIDDGDSIKSIHHALELGINFFDTADVYGFGHSEEILSKALGHRKKDVIIATKFGVNWNNAGITTKDCSPKRLLTALEGSLRRLNIDCIPLYQIHWPDNKTKIDDVIDTLEKCQIAGKIISYGCSNFSLNLMNSIKNINKITTQQSQFNLLDRQNKDLIQECSNKYKISNIVYGVLARGLLSGKFSANSFFSKNDSRKEDPNFIGERLIKNLKVVELLQYIGLRYSKTPSQIAIRWVLQNVGIDIILLGISKTNQIEEDIEVFNWNLLHQDFSHLSKCIDTL